MEPSASYALFDTAIGRCAIVFTERGIAAVFLPEAHDGVLRRRLAPAREAAPPPSIRQAIERITALLSGRFDDLADLTLDLDRVPAFHRRVYEFARTIPPGATMTYGDIAARLGDVSAARAVGQALGRNPFAIVVPCHRVLAAGGRWGGFSAPGGVETKRRLLRIEGARLDTTSDLFEQGGAP